MNNLKKEFFQFWNLLFLLVALVFLLQHLFFGLFHFQDCDSSGFYEYLQENSLEKMNSFINYVTPDPLIKIRLFAADFSQKLTFLPLQKGLQLPFVSTYPPLMGLIFGIFSGKNFEDFAIISNFINGIALLISSSLLFFTFQNLNFSKRISFAISSLLLTFYATNSYSYHFGSTIWYIFSISLGIFLASIKNSFIKDFFSAIVQFISYPFIVWYFCDLIINFVYVFSTKTINKNSLQNNILKILRKRTITIIGILINIILFLPFNSGYRYGPDLRGLYSIFSFQPLNNQTHIYAILFSLMIYFFCFYGLINFSFKLKKYNNKRNLFENFKQLVQDLENNKVNKKYKVFVYCIFFLFVFTILVLLRKLTFTTTRHSLFIIPSILFLTAYGAEELVQDIKNKLIKFNKIISFSIITFISLTFVVSNYSSFQRIDILKIEKIPQNISNFVTYKNNIDYSIIGCSPHYKYADFSGKKISYSLTKKHNISDIYDPGEKLLISQRPIISQSQGEYENSFTNYLFFGIPKKGDEIVVDSKNVKITILGKPYIKKTSIYFDSLNQNSEIFNLFHFFRKVKTKYINTFQPSKIDSNNTSNSLIYEWYDFYSRATGEEYRYPRPNDIWLIPLKVEQLND